VLLFGEIESEETIDRFARSARRAVEQRNIDLMAPLAAKFWGAIESTYFMLPGTSAKESLAGLTRSRKTNAESAFSS